MNRREEEELEDERLEREIELSKIRPVWDGDNGYLPKPPPKQERFVKQYRPRL